VTVAQLKKNMAAMIGKTARTVTNRLSKLVEKGLLKEDTKDGSNIYILTENSERY
jgi:Fic family protein